MENEENFNWLEIYMDIQEGKDIKNSPAFKLLNSNNIDTNELTRHEKDKDAGVVKLNYKDEKEKETDSISFSKGLLAFVADMPEETVKALMMAFLNGTDVAANAAGVVFNAMTNSDPAVALAFQEGNPEKFKKLVNANIQEFSKYLNEQKKEVKEIGEGSELNSKAAQFVSMVTQDTPYSLPIYKKLTSLGMPKYMALPVAYGIGSGVAFDDDAQIFLNSEQVQSFKEMVGALPNSSEEKIFNTTYRTLEGTALGFAIPYVFNGLKFAKNTIPKFMKPQSTISVGGAATSGVGAEKIIDKSLETQDQSSISGTVNEYGFEKTAGLTNLAVQFLKKSGTKVQDLKKIPGGTGRSVFALDNDKVIKIAKMQRGIRENMNETDDFMIDSWRPKVFEKGDDFVVVENVARADAQTRSFLKPLQEFNQNDFNNKTSELQETMEALGLEDFLNYDLAWRDFIAARNWGKTKDGRIVLLDGGALDITTLSKEVPDYVNKDWQEILSGRKKEGMGKFIIVAGASQGYRILDTKAEANILMDNVLSNEPTTDAEIDKAYGEGASENAMVEALKPKTNQDMQNMITKAEKADDQVLFFDGEKESGPDDPINDYIKITDPKALEGADIVFYDDETMEQMTYQKINETDDDWIILNQDRKTSYNQ